MTFNGSEALDESIRNGEIRISCESRALTQASDGLSEVSVVKIQAGRLFKEFPPQVSVGLIDVWADWQPELSCGLRSRG